MCKRQQVKPQKSQSHKLTQKTVIHIKIKYKNGIEQQEEEKIEQAHKNQIKINLLILSLNKNKTKLNLYLELHQEDKILNLKMILEIVSKHKEEVA